MSCKQGKMPDSVISIYFKSSINIMSLYLGIYFAKFELFGLLLPCNVIVQETLDGKVEVAAIDPVASMHALENKKLQEVAEKVQEKLKKAIENL